jgi:ribose transport system permease protein
MKIKDILLRLGFLLLLCVFIGFLNDNFTKTENLINILRQASLLFILGIGMTLVILSGGIDLSNGSVLVFSSCIGALVLKTNLPTILGILTIFSCGIACGLLNGIMITKIRIPPFIATFAMLFIGRGLAYIILQGRVLFGFKPEFLFFGTGAFLGIPMPIICCILIFLIFSVVLGFTAFGVNIYAVGSDADSARLVGINVSRTTIVIYILSGLLSSFAGLLYTARLDTASPMVGASFPLDAIAIVIIGGAALQGGEGNLAGTGIGALIITVMQNGMNLMAISSLWQQFVTGGIILTLIVMQKCSTYITKRTLHITGSSL